jgi:site-specific recombinase XerD
MSSPDKWRSEIMSIRKRGKRYWFRFMWKGEWIEKSTGQGNANVARQIEAAHRTALAKGEHGILERKVAPTLKRFAEESFLPYTATRFAKKRKTREYYEYGAKCLVAFDRLASEQLDRITNDLIGSYVAARQAVDNEITTINRQLQVLRRMLALAEKWKMVDRKLVTVEMLPGERRRDRVLSPAEEALYWAAARSGLMQKHTDSTLLADVVTILIDCALRPEECFRLRPTNVVDDGIEVLYGKTENARRRIPMTARVRAIIEMRLEKSRGSKWIFPAPTESGHIEKSSLRKQHATAIREATRLLREQTGNKSMQFESFDLYSLRHTCLTRWAPHMDPWTLMRLAGHSDMATTKRYIHPEDETTRQAMQRARDAVDLRAQEAVNRARKAMEGPQNGDRIGDSANLDVGSSHAEERVN